MEDVSKALLIGAGMFFAILLISSLVILHGQVSSMYSAKQDANIIEQTRKFNAKFENYNREDIRGNDLISLMNMVIDYNEAQSYEEGTGYDRILVTIDLDSFETLKQFMYDENYDRNAYLRSSITNIDSGNSWENDRELIKITNTSTDLIEILETELGLENASDTQLQKLSSKASSIILNNKDNDGETAEWAITYRIKRANLIKDILGVTISIDSKGKTDPSDVNKVQKIKDITNIYYQYTQFKRAMFDCTKITYDTDTNRIKEMNFKLQVKTENGDKKVVFD